MGDIPPYMGKLRHGDVVVGSAFWVHAEGLIATCDHVLTTAQTTQAGDTLIYEDLSSGGTLQAQVTTYRDARHDLALLHTSAAAPSVVPRVIPSARAASGMRFHLVGYGELVDKNHEYAHLSASGLVIGPVRRDNIDLLQLECKQILRGMSGAPVIVEDVGGVVGVVSGRYTAQLWMQDTVWAAKSEHLIDLLCRALGKPYEPGEDMSQPAEDAQATDEQLIRALISSCNATDVHLLTHIVLGMSDEYLDGTNLKAKILSLVEQARQNRKTRDLIRELLKHKKFLADEYPLLGQHARD
jgi:hypothetical protein